MAMTPKRDGPADGPAFRLRGRGRRRRACWRRSRPMPSTTSSAGRPARPTAAMPRGRSTRRCSPICPTARSNASAASTATTSWSTSRCGAARRRAGRSASRARTGRSSSACCTSSSSPPTATMQRENVWIDLRADHPAAAAGLTMAAADDVGRAEPEAAHPQGPAAGGLAPDEAGPASPTSRRSPRRRWSRGPPPIATSRASRRCCSRPRSTCAVPEAAEVLRDAPADDPVARLQRVDTALHDMILANEAQLRLMLVHSLQRSAARAASCRRGRTGARR